jgi:hypothetical protein
VTDGPAVRELVQTAGDRATRRSVHAGAVADGLAATASLLAAGLLASLVHWWLRSGVAFADASNLEVVKTTVTVTAFAGAVLAGVYAFRKQLLAEGDAHRADAAQLAQRYTAAAGASLGSSTNRARRARRGLPRLRPTRW